MASKDAAFANSSTLDRMGALAKWIAAKAEEMAQMDRRIERRIDHLQRSEDNLRTMFEAIRDQVANAHSISGELQKRAFTADERHQQVDSALSDALDKASELASLLDAKARELEQTAQSVSQETSDRLSQLMEQAQQAKAAGEASAAQAFISTASAPLDPLDEQSEAGTIQYAFEQRSAEVVESIRRSAVEQIDRLASQAAVAVEPILSRIDSHRERVEAQLRAAVETAEDSLRRRAEELSRTGDTIVDDLEQRLARRLDSVRPKTVEKLETAERAMNQRLNILLDGAKLNVSSTETDLMERIAQLRPRISQALQAAQNDVAEQLARMEEHAFAMTGWLEKRISERVDALIARTRTTLSETSIAAIAPASPEAVSLACYSDEYPAPASPTSVDVKVFVDGKGERSRRSSTASIFQ